MSEKIFDELQKLYDNSKVGALVQEICEYYATSDSYEDNSYQDEIEPRDLTEAVYTLFCLQCREQILDEFALVGKKYPEVYGSVEALHNKLLVNMDYRRLEEECAMTIMSHNSSVSKEDILNHVDSCTRTSDNLSAALDKFYSWLH